MAETSGQQLPWQGKDMTQVIEQMNHRFDLVDQKFAQQEERFAAIDTRISDMQEMLNTRISDMQQTIDIRNSDTQQTINYRFNDLQKVLDGMRTTNSIWFALLAFLFIALGTAGTIAMFVLKSGT